MMEQIIVSILALVVSILGLLLSFYVVSKNKPKILVEKDTLEVKKTANEVWICFYLSNVGERPATIKKIDFYNPETRYMPNTTVLQTIDKTVLGIGVNLPTNFPVHNYSTLDFPFSLNAHSTIKLLAKLNFPTGMKKETERKKFTYMARVDYSNKIFEKLI